MRGNIARFDTAFLLLFSVVCSEQSTGSQEHAPSESTASLCTAAGASRHEDRRPGDCSGEIVGGTDELY